MHRRHSNRPDTRFTHSSAPVRTTQKKRSVSDDQELPSIPEQDGQPRAKLSWGRKLSHYAEGMFRENASLNLPAVVWAGYFLLGFLAFITGGHSVTYQASPSLEKEVGFFWALSWPLECLVLYPAFLMIVRETVAFWYGQRRELGSSGGTEQANVAAWRDKVGTYATGFWVIVFTSVVIVFGAQWGGVFLNELLAGKTEGLKNWFLVATVRPEVISIPEAVIVSFFAFVYSGIIYWFYLVGLLLLFIIASDFSKRMSKAADEAELDVVLSAGERISRNIYVCTVIGILVSSVIALNATYLTADGEFSLSWVVNDFLAGLGVRSSDWDWLGNHSPSTFTSAMLIAVHCFVFVASIWKIQTGVSHITNAPSNLHRSLSKEPVDKISRMRRTWALMVLVVAMLSVNFLMIGRFVGFTLVFASVVVLAVASIWRMTRL